MEIPRLQHALAVLENMYETQSHQLTERQAAEREFFNAAAAAIEALQPVAGDAQ
ncbi:hypothetical protein [Paraburkholderia sp. HD33-4]|uniref:hypothetical protein n=1 Tax=Paraburkholderia sp. HD33-4 TaxID=2883242 RepID=UPI001F4919BC|nr:hypothetical protein [Paraburkholderia sp. HD33-4]